MGGWERGALPVWQADSSIGAEVPDSEAREGVFAPGRVPRALAWVLHLSNRPFERQQYVVPAGA